MRRCQPFPNKFPWRGARDPELTGEIPQTTDTSVQSDGTKRHSDYISESTFPGVFTLTVQMDVPPTYQDTLEGFS